MREKSGGEGGEIIELEVEGREERSEAEEIGRNRGNVGRVKVDMLQTGSRGKRGVGQRCANWYFDCIDCCEVDKVGK